MNEWTNERRGTHKVSNCDVLVDTFGCVKIVVNLISSQFLKLIRKVKLHRGDIDGNAED